MLRVFPGNPHEERSADVVIVVIARTEFGGELLTPKRESNVYIRHVTFIVFNVSALSVFGYRD